MLARQYEHEHTWEAGSRQAALLLAWAMLWIGEGGTVASPLNTLGSDLATGLPPEATSREAFAAFANGELPIRHIYYSTDPGLLGHSGSVSAQCYFEGSFQTNTFYIKRAVSADATSTNAAVWGRSYSGPWFVVDGVSYLTVTPLDENDPVVQSVGRYRSASDLPLSLGLSPPVVPGTLSWVAPTSLRGTTIGGHIIVIEAQVSDDRVQTLTMKVDLGKGVTLQRAIRYRYLSSQQPMWLPSEVVVSDAVAGGGRGGHSVAWALTIRSCELGLAEAGPRGYEAAMFLENGGAEGRSAIFSNGAAYRVDGSVTSLVRKAISVENIHMSQSPARATTIRIVTVSLIILSTLACLIYVLLRQDHRNTQEAKDHK